MNDASGARVATRSAGFGPRAWPWLWLFTQACQPHAPTTRVVEGDDPPLAKHQLPDVGLVDLDLKPVTFAGHIGARVGVVDFWATWCAACKQDHEILERLAQAYPSDDLALVGVNQGEDAARVREYTQAHSYSYDVWLDPDFKLAEALGETSLPVVYVVDPQGNIVHRTTGLDAPSLQIIRREVDRLRSSR